MEIPVVDLARTRDSELARARAVDALDEALARVGALTVVHHGVHPRTVARATDAVRTLLAVRGGTSFRFAGPPARWPEDVIGLREAVTAYLDASVDLLDRLIGLAGLAVARDERVLSRRLAGAACRFEAAAAPPLDGDLTLLAADGRPGIEIADGAGGWHPVHAPMGALVVTVGPSFAELGGGRWRAAAVRPGPAAEVESRRLTLAVVQDAARARLAAAR